jgi:AraC-like DNA-binding protein
MKPYLNLLLILSLLGVTQALLLAFALFSAKRGNRIANRILAAVALTLALSMAGVMLVSARYGVVFTRVGKINQPLSFLVAPLLFLYVKALIARKATFHRKELLHFIPAGLCALYLIPYWASKAGTGSPYYGAQWFNFRAGVLIVHFLIYLGLIALMLVDYSRKNKGGDPATQKMVLSQIRFLLITFLGLWALGFLQYILNLISPAYRDSAEADLAIPLCLTAFLYALAYLSLRQPGVLTGDNISPPAKRYETSNLTPERSERYAERLLRFMETEKPYTDSELTLQKLAEKLAIPARHLSRIINERFNQNFADFINSYRVEEAKKRLLDLSKKHYSVLAIAEEVGFSSKSSFNLVFKKHTHMTPSEFRKAANGNHP